MQRTVDSTLAAQATLADLSPDSPWISYVAQALLGYGPDHVRLWMADVNRLASIATSYTASADMTELVRHAAAALAAEWVAGDVGGEQLLPYDVPTPYGFVRFAHPIDLRDTLAMPGTPTADFAKVAGFLWRTDDFGIAFMPIVDRTMWDFELPGRGTAPAYFPVDQAGWTFGTRWRIDPDAELGMAKYRDRTLAPVTGGFDEDGAALLNPVAGQDRCLLYAFFRLVEQKLPRIDQVRPSRNELRRSTRKHPGLVPEDGTLRYVALRKETSDHDRPDTPGEVAWSHRWVVQGHWAKRRVAVRAADGTITGDRHGVEGQDWIYRRVFIAPHVKGPEDKPLVVKDTVNVLRR